MALIRCPECGQSVSEHAIACPNCGYPISVDQQKKIGFEYQGGCDALIWSASRKALLHGGDDCLVLLSGYSDGFLVHEMPPDR